MIINEINNWFTAKNGIVTDVDDLTLNNRLVIIICVEKTHEEMRKIYVVYEDYTSRETCADMLMFRILFNVCRMINRSKV
jgi:hypothetical protein